MKWKKYTIETTTEAEDFISSMLADLGVEGVQVEDNIPLSHAEQEQEQFLVQVQKELENLRAFVEIGTAKIMQEETEDKDWINNWKQYFTSFAIDDILIKPTWEERNTKGDYRCVIEIDPGTSFGTGKHETTQLCIRQLLKYIRPEDRVLDVGCGSGILSVISLKLGAGHVTGIDIDPICMEAVAENMQVNGLSSEKGSFYQGNLIDDLNLQREVGGEYEIVVANILADIIIPLTPVIPERLKKGGLYITSGIIDFKEEAVKQAILEAGLEVLEIQHQGEWVSITARK